MGQLAYYSSAGREELISGPPLLVQKTQLQDSPMSSKAIINDPKLTLSPPLPKAAGNVQDLQVAACPSISKILGLEVFNNSFTEVFHSLSIMHFVRSCCYVYIVLYSISL